MGYAALNANTTAGQNTAVGRDAMKLNQTAYSCTAVGAGS